MKKYLTFVIISGFVVGIASATSDHVRPCHLIHCNVYEIILIFLSGVLNDLITWLAMSILMGFLFGHSWKQSMSAGIGSAMFAMCVYFAISLGANPNSTGSTVNLVERFSMFLEWFTLTFVGGAIGGLIGFSFRRHPVSLLVFVLFVMARIIQNGSLSWQNLIGILQNTTFLLLAVGAILLMVIRMRSGISGNSLPES